MAKSKWKPHTPDGLDLDQITSVLVDDYGLLVEMTATKRDRQWYLIARARDYRDDPGGPPQYQALSRISLGDKRDWQQIYYSLCWDLWSQAEKGIIGEGGRPGLKAPSRAPGKWVPAPRENSQKK